MAIHITCALACLSYTVPSQRRLFHGDPIPRFVLTNPEEKFRPCRALRLFFFFKLGSRLHGSRTCWHLSRLIHETLQAAAEESSSPRARAPCPAGNGTAAS